MHGTMIIIFVGCELRKNESIFEYLSKTHPALVEDEFFNPKDAAVISIPIKAPTGATTRDEETALDLLNRVSQVYNTWIKVGHRKGDNTNNVSCTVTVKEDEWASVGKWMWEHREEFTALSVLPYDGGTYRQMPFESISQKEYERMIRHLKEIDLTCVVELQDDTQLSSEAACAAGACEI
jgi:ribonucleoside-triphosphate reductase